MRLVSNLFYNGFDLPGLEGPLTDNDILHIFDVFEFEDLEALLKQRGYPKYIVTDHFERIDHPTLKFYTLPLYPSSLVESYKPYRPTVDIDTRYIFNFTFNKKQISRFLCLKLVEFFKLTSYDYTNSGFNQSGGMSHVLQELDSLGDLAPLQGMDRGFILAPSTIPPKFFHTRANLPPDDSRLVVHFKSDWPDHLECIVTHSAVTLLCESNWNQPGTVFTEKTLNSVLGHTFPSWIGGYKQAEGWKNLGFDTFDDIIDHKYYDQESDWTTRIHKIHEVVEDLLTQDLQLYSPI